MRLFIDVYKADNKIATSGATSLAGLDLQRTYRAIDSVATGRILSLSCANINVMCLKIEVFILTGENLSITQQHATLMHVYVYC